MKAIDRLYRKDNNVVRSILIDQDLYEQIQYLSKNIFDASVSKIINVCIEHTLMKEKEIVFYKKPRGADSTYRSIMIRKKFFEKLLKLREDTGVSLNRIINGCIKDFLEDYKEELK